MPATDFGHSTELGPPCHDGLVTVLLFRGPGRLQRQLGHVNLWCKGKPQLIHTPYVTIVICNPYLYFAGLAIPCLLQ